MPDKQLVINLTPSEDQGYKPQELIKIRTDRDLKLYARRAITILWHNAHKIGLNRDGRYTINMSELRSQGHKGNEEARAAIKALQSTLLTVRIPKSDREVTTQMLGPTIEDGYSRKDGVLTYRFPTELFDILKKSSVWGEIEIPVLMHLSSKYAISLYEHASQWINLTYKNSEKFSIEEFRQMVGVEEGKYELFGGLNANIIKKAIDEINALSSFVLTATPIKTGKRVTHIRIFWRHKNVEEKKAAYRELTRHSSGRKARIRGQEEVIEIDPQLASPKTL